MQRKQPQAGRKNQASLTHVWVPLGESHTSTTPLCLQIDLAYAAEQAGVGAAADVVEAGAEAVAADLGAAASAMKQAASAASASATDASIVDAIQAAAAAIQAAAASAQDVASQVQGLVSPAVPVAKEVRAGAGMSTGEVGLL